MILLGFLEKKLTELRKTDRFKKIDTPNKVLTKISQIFGIDLKNQY
jgi:hypothetical protein